MTTTANSKQSNSLPINIKFPNKDLFMSLPFTQYTISGFKQENCKACKRQKPQYEEKKQVTVPELHIADILELSD